MTKTRVFLLVCEGRCSPLTGAYDRATDFWSRRGDAIALGRQLIHTPHVAVDAPTFSYCCTKCGHTRRWGGGSAPSLFGKGGEFYRPRRKAAEPESEITAELQEQEGKLGPGELKAAGLRVVKGVH